MNQSCDVSIGYLYLLDIAYCLERIIGKDKMQSSYMRADLNSVIDNLSEYSIPNDIKDFLVNTDYLIREIDCSSIFQNKKKIIAFLKSVNEFLISVNAQKWLTFYIKYDISLEQAATQLVRFDSLIVKNQNIGGSNHVITRQKDIDDCLKDVYKGRNRQILDTYQRLRMY